MLFPSNSFGFFSGNLQLMNKICHSSPVSLNVLACDSTFKIVKAVLEKGVNITKVQLLPLVDIVCNNSSVIKKTLMLCMATGNQKMNIT